MGVRYNAEKKKTGKYYSTTIYKFRMKCHLCENHFEIQTDPKNLDYEILSGGRRQERRWDPTKNEQVVPEEKGTSQKLASDPMYSLEHQAEDERRRDEMTPVIQQIQGIQERMKDDFACNQLLRKQFRVCRLPCHSTAVSDCFSFRLPSLIAFIFNCFSLTAIL